MNSASFDDFKTSRCNFLAMANTVLADKTRCTAAPCVVAVVPFALACFTFKRFYRAILHKRRIFSSHIEERLQRFAFVFLLGDFCEYGRLRARMTV